MKIPGKVLMFLIALHRTPFILAAVKHKGKTFGESCVTDRDCGDSSSSFILCEDNTCQCPDFLYYQEQDKMCVSFVGEKCDVSEPSDGLPTVVCGLKSECIQLRHERFGRCVCMPGHVKNFDRKCEATRSQVNLLPQDNRGYMPKPFPTGNQNHVLEPAQNNNGPTNSNNDGTNIISFPYYKSASANTHSGASSSFHSTFKYIRFYHSGILICFALTFTRRFLLL